MSDPYLGEIRAFGFNYPPYGWALCDGQLLSVGQYGSLFALLGTYYGGNGQSTFGLPNFQGVAPMHWGAGSGLSPYVLGEQLGAPTVTLLTLNMPSHNHTLQSAQGSGAQLTPTPDPTAWPGNSIPGQAYLDTNTLPSAFSPKAIGFSGSSNPHSNIQPLLTLNICIAVQGVFPPHG